MTRTGTAPPRRRAARRTRGRSRRSSSGWRPRRAGSPRRWRSAPRPTYPTTASQRGSTVRRSATTTSTVKVAVRAYPSVSPMALPSTVCQSSKRCSAAGAAAGSSASSLMPGTRVTQRCRPTTWTVAAATPTTGDPAAEGAAGQPTEPDTGRRHQRGADDEDAEPAHHRALLCSRKSARMSPVGSSRICGYAKTEPSAVKPAMARSGGEGERGRRRGGRWSVEVRWSWMAPWWSGWSVARTAARSRYHASVVASASSRGVARSPKRGAELAVVDDPRVGELVERVQVLAHLRLDQPDRAEGGPAGGEQPGSVAGEPVDRRRSTCAGGAGLRRRAGARSARSRRRRCPA